MKKYKWIDKREFYENADYYMDAFSLEELEALIQNPATDAYKCYIMFKVLPSLTPLEKFLHGVEDV